MKITRTGWTALFLLALGLMFLCFHFQATLMIRMQAPQFAVDAHQDTRPDAIKYESAWMMLGWVSSVMGCLGCFAGAFFAGGGVFGVWEGHRP